MQISNQVLQLALFALVALAMLVQAIVLLAAFLAMRKAAKSMGEKLEEVRTAVMPVIATSRELITTSRDLITKLAPRIDAASEDLVSTIHTVRVQAAELQTVTNEMVERARGQASRLDSIMTNFFDGMDRAGSFVADCVNKPMRQFSALLNSAKAVVESLRSTSASNRTPSNHAPGDHDMFV
jgi:hypothetical protein